MSIASMFHQLILSLVLVVFCSSGQLWGQISSVFNMEVKERWDLLGSFEFAEEFQPSGLPKNTWGSAIIPANPYGQVTQEAGSAVVVVESPNDQDIVVLEFDVRYLKSQSAHGYLAISDDFSLDHVGGDGGSENTLWFGIGGGVLQVGTNSDFTLGNQGTPGSGAAIVLSKPLNIPDDRRIGLRIGYDPKTAAIPQILVDSDNNGSFETRLLEGPVSVSNQKLDPVDWQILGIVAAGSTRFDDVRLLQNELRFDFDKSLALDLGDADVICAGIPGGDLKYDYTQDGIVNVTDAERFAFGNRSLPGDADFDGTVGFSDFLLLSQSFSGGGTWSNGNFDCDEDVDFVDFLRLSNSFGNSVGQGAIAARSAIVESSLGLGERELATIPEPVMGGLFIVCGWGFCRAYRVRGKG